MSNNELPIAVVNPFQNFVTRGSSANIDLILMGGSPPMADLENWI
jgi:hypothetical protein